MSNNCELLCEMATRALGLSRAVRMAGGAGAELERRANARVWPKGSIVNRKVVYIFTTVVGVYLLFNPSQLKNDC
jgi:hypothetical protein